MIGLTTKYAIRILRTLSSTNESSEFMNTEELAARANIPKPYLSKVVMRLAAAELIETRRGKSGGARLSRELGSLSLYEVCTALGDPIVNETCFLSQKNCSSSKHCAFHSDWQKARIAFHKFLKTCTVEVAGERLS